MAIFLTILKIIGIVLLVLLGIILLLLIILLFAPIRYEANATYLENAFVFRAKATYLWPILRANASFTKEEGVVTKVKLLWFSLFEEKEDKPPKPKKRRLKKEKRTAKKSDVEETDTKKSNIENHTKESSETKIEIKPFEEPQKSEKETEKKTKKTKQSKKMILSSFWEKLKSKWNDIKAKVRRLYESFQKTTDKAKWMKKLYDTQTTKDALTLVKKLLGGILKRYRPRKIRGRLYFGFADPALTGETLGALAMAYPWMNNRIQVVPNFQEACFEEELYLMGRIQLYVIVYAALRLYFNKKVRVTWKRFNKIKGGNES